MGTENILSKITPKDYHNELEVILDDKDFKEDVKNLLLSCVYKIEAGYEDYKMVKRIVETKKEYLEKIMEILKKKCNHIEIIKDEKNDNNTKKYEINKMDGTIYLWHPNESMLLYAIYEIDDRQIYVDEKYSILRIALSELLNKGENINNLEVLRDFNGWNWNTSPKEIGEVTLNLIYQNLIYLLGLPILKKWIYMGDTKDYLEVVKQKLILNYGEENAKEIFKWIEKLAFVILRRK